MEGHPFAFLGVNGDSSREQAKEAMKADKMTWRSWWDGPRPGPIARRWNVRYWKYAYVIDADGVIRNKGLPAEYLEKAVEDLVKEKKRNRGGS